MNLNLENQQLHRRLLRERDAYLSPEATRRPAFRPEAPVRHGYRVELIVRQRGYVSEHLFVHESDKLSQLEARLDAERAAREAGYPVVGRLHAITRR